MKTILRGLGTATPPLYVTQEEVYEFFSTQLDLKPAEQALYRRILLDGKIKGVPEHPGLRTSADKGAHGLAVCIKIVFNVLHRVPWPHPWLFLYFQLK